MWHSCVWLYTISKFHTRDGDDTRPRHNSKFNVSIRYLKVVITSHNWLPDYEQNARYGFCQVSYFEMVCWAQYQKLEKMRTIWFSSPSCFTEIGNQSIRWVYIYEGNGHKRSLRIGVICMTRGSTCSTSEGQGSVCLWYQIAPERVQANHILAVRKAIYSLWKWMK